MTTAETYMHQCLQLAQQAKGHTAPNPMVGAVLVHNERIIGEGWHHCYGGDHAEVNCLNNVAAADKALVPDSTMYVSLEPCAHYGLTPPCATRLVAEHIKKVVIANTDPFAQVSGRGIAILEAARITVQTDVLAAAAQWVNRRFFCFHSSKRPYIILKWAQTADGYIAPTNRSRYQISGPESAQLVHRWRTEEAAILVGTTTALNDNPQLTARLHTGKQPLRIALDRKLAVPHTHHLYDTAAATWMVNEEKETLHGNVHYIRQAFDNTLLPALLQRLHNAHILSLIVEGGAALLNSFIAAGLWDEARVFTSPGRLMDGVAAPLLPAVMAATEMSSGADVLRVFVNNNSSYPYVAGMPL